MEWGRAYGYFRDDPEWKGKVMMASLAILTAMLIPVLGQIIVGGWTAILLRRILAGDDKTLPPIGFDNIGELLNAGFKPFLVQTLWMLPLTLVAMIGGFVAAFGGMIGAGAATAARRSGEAPSPAFGGGMLLCFLAIYVLILVGSVVFGIFAHCAVTRTEVSDDMSQGMKFGAVMEMAKRSWGDILKTMLLSGIINYFIVLFGMMLLCVGVFPATVVTMLAGTHLRAQIYRKYLAKGGTAVPLKVEPGTTPPELRPQAF